MREVSDSLHLRRFYLVALGERLPCPVCGSHARAGRIIHAVTLGVKLTTTVTARHMVEVDQMGIGS